MRQTQPTARNLPTDEVAAYLCALTGLARSDGEGAVDAKRPAPRAVDATAWIAWALAGLYACALPSEIAEGEESRGPWVPPIRVMVREARRAAVVLAMVRHAGNFTHAAKALGTSRKALRDTLKAAGLYPWGGASEGDDDDASTPALEGSDMEGGE
jgi:DNA-binding transcriptional LysR family regulator